ncbi:TPA_asm: GHKL domain-containing protein, partial [Listeria monocytogenes]|nr:GHKL domain-containing protein [Listeria monocytogenes]
SSQLEYFFITDKVDEVDKNLVVTLMGGSAFDYPIFYDINTLIKLQKKIVPILKKYEDIEQLVEDIESSLEIIDIQNETVAFSMLDELYQRYELPDPQTGMILVMQGLRDEWKQKDIDKLQKELRLLVAPDLIEQDPFIIELNAPEFRIEDIVLINEILDSRYAKVDAKIYDNAKKIYISYKDKDGKTDLIEEELEQPLLCGDVYAEVYFFLRDANNLTNAGAGYNFRFALKMLDTYCGIKIYRDNFRVKPYGDIGNDWLFLDQKKVKDTHGYLVGNNQVIGVVKIGDVANPLLVDATNREGIIENEAYEQLINFLTKCTNLISDVRRKAYLADQENEKKLAAEKEKIDAQFDNVKKQYQDNPFMKQIEEVTQTTDHKAIPEKLEQLAKAYIEDSEKKKADIQKLQNDYDHHYSETKRIYQDKINFQESELNLYKNLASLGMLTGSFGHETSDIVSRIQTSLHLINVYLDKDVDKNQIKDVVSIVSGDFGRIYAYSNLIVNFLRKRKREVTADIDFGSVLAEVTGFYRGIVNSFNVTLDTKCEQQIIYAMKQIDLESIIINMVTNAFEQVKGKQIRQIRISIEQSLSHIILNFEDSGDGVPKGKENDIFRPFETTKEEGIGLGLNIVKDIVENYGGEIKVERSETLHGAKFVVLLPKGGNEE